MRKRKEEILSTSLYAKQNNEQFGIVIISNSHNTYCLKTVTVFGSQLSASSSSVRVSHATAARCALGLQSPGFSPAWQGWACKVAHPHGRQLMQPSAGSSAGAIKQTACAWLPQQAASGNGTSHVAAAALKASIPRNSGACV